MNNRNVKCQGPYFSICIPVYNAQKHLAECIDSVLTQTYTDYEIILVDDGSEDLSSQICNQYALEHPNIQTISKKNEGPLLARHDAVKASRGQYLLFLDSDDLLDPTLLEKMKQTIEDTAADMVVYDFSILFPDGRKMICTESFENKVSFEDATKPVFLEYFVSHGALNSMWRKCMHRDVYDIDADYSRYKGLIQGEDKLVSIHCIDRAKKIVYLKKALYSYRKNEAGTTHNMTLKNYKDIQIVRRELAKYIECWGLASDVKEKQLATRLDSTHNCIMSIALRVENGKGTMADLREAVNYIASDEDFLEAYRISGKRLNASKKLVCNCIIKKYVSTIRLLALAVQIKNKIKNTILLSR